MTGLAVRPELVAGAGARLAEQDPSRVGYALVLPVLPVLPLVLVAVGVRHRLGSSSTGLSRSSSSAT